jgi:hypothetical protein
MTQSRPRTRTIAVALCAAALSVLSVSPAIVSAQDNGPTDPGVRCAAKVGPGQYEFYLPGEKATDVDGNKWVCGPDGQWFRDYSAAIVANPTYRPPTVKTGTIAMGSVSLATTSVATKSVTASFTR